MRSNLDRRLVILSAATAIALAGCVDGFGGSNVQIDFSAKVGEAGPQQPPANTYFTLYAVDQIVDATTGAITAEYLFDVQRFSIRSAVDLTSPCAIEVEGPYPGLHISAFAEKEREQTGVADPFLPGQDERSVERVLTADQRMLNAAAMASIKAVTSTSFAAYPPVAPACVEDMPGVDPSQIPPAGCLGDASAERRLALCQATWATDPLRYEGTDRSLTAPLAGTVYGFVQGQNPVNGATLGGSQIFVDEVLDFDAYAINWQYADLDGDGMPDYPASVPAENRSPTGFPYVSGFPKVKNRGVVTVPMLNRADPSIAAQMAIFADLGEDPVQF